MIQAKSDSVQTPGWHRELAEAISDPAELLRELALPATLLPAALAASRQFGLRVPRAYLTRMRKADANDPLLRQVLPLAEELEARTGFSRDPVGDLNAMRVPGLLQKYRGRVLLVTTGACAVHCRYCFRRHFPYADANPAGADWTHALEHIAADDSISEVILSGGDPLTMSDRRLADLATRLGRIPHLRRLRLHTRLPVVLPSRVDERLLDWLGKVPLQRIVVLHANHPNELDSAVHDAACRLADAGVSLLNQAVLLRGINDSVTILEQLSERLFAAGVLPYYLHQLDAVEGAAHFAVDETSATELLRQLQNRLPGYLVPRLVRELPGAPAKQPLLPPDNTGVLIVESDRK